MSAQQLFASSPLSGSHPAEPQLKWMVVLSGVAHLAAFVIIMGLPPSSSRDIYYSPSYTVDLVGMPAGGTPFAGSGEKSSGKSAAGEVKKQHVKLWKGPAAIAPEVKVQAGRKHPVLEIPAKGKNLTPQRAEQEPDSTSAKGGSAEESPGAASAEKNSPETAAETSGQGTGGGVPGPGPGGPGSGGGAAANLRLSRYYQALYEKIYQSWILPDYVTEKDGSREVTVVIKIQRDGKILGASFEKASGNRQLDASVMNALKKADPLPPLPDDVREGSLEIGIRFIPQQKAQ